jgi:glucosamine--fructose-6-phosphate aminotransferase (isomerizing)
LELSIVGSSIAREADKVFYTLAGPEISVATTKAYSTQLMASYILAIEFAKVKNTITEEQYENYIAELQAIPEKIEKIIESSGLQQSRQTQRTHFLSDVELIMQSVWKAA